MGGISRTIDYKGNRIDIGGHRFFSRSDRVMNWWLNILPLQASPLPQSISYQRKVRTIDSAPAGPDPSVTDAVMLIRRRKSRIYFTRKFFDYPITLSGDTISKLGMAKMMRIGLSYARAAMFPIRNEQTLEQFFINRFGRELYLTFFRSYTEKVWGVPCKEIKASWGAQRIKGLSIAKALAHLAKKIRTGDSGIAQKETETSLIEQFMYPKFGPGQMWDAVSSRVKASGGHVLTGWNVDRIHTKGDRVTGVEAQNWKTGEHCFFQADYVFSTMPIQEFIKALDADIPEEVQAISDGLVYRDFITVGLLLKSLKLKEPDGRPLQDNWIYIQEPDVKLGRLQIFNNWSPHLVADPSTVWLGLEYFCYETDDMWKLSDAAMIDLATKELVQIGMIDAADVLDGTVIRAPKTYPAYFGTYDKFDSLREYVDKYRNLYLIGRNGMHKYNNQDHSMLTAMVSVDNIIEGREDTKNIWEVNTEDTYHETKAQARAAS